MNLIIGFSILLLTIVLLVLYISSNEDYVDSLMEEAYKDYKDEEDIINSDGPDLNKKIDAKEEDISISSKESKK